ncbi:MAG: hypothetical protein JEZ09_13260 [Salinivirgaceae bacterium]|nr:hypothetical protein [Salinivirgaceae bacterium]
MKITIKLSVLFLAILSSHSLIAQDFSTIDSYSKTASYAECKSPEKLAEYLNKKAATDLEKVRAYYIWLTHNVKYDTKSFFSGNVKPSTAIDALKQRKAVCQGYSELFKALCDYSNISCFIVSGYSKGYGFNPNRKITNADHAWNAVKIANKWYLLDATWGAGYVDDKQRFKEKPTNEFFLTDPKEFILKHLPSDPMWQLIGCPLSIDDFRKNDEVVKKVLDESKNDCFSFNDTIAQFESLPEIDQKVNSAERSFRFNPGNYEIPGFAYLNLAYEVSQNIGPLYDQKKYKEALALNKKALMINERAYYYLKKSKSDQSKNAANIAKQNIDQLKTAIKSLKDLGLF